jgi:hypothetical protein
LSLSLLLAGASTASGGYRGAVLSDGPTGYWRLGERDALAAADETGQHDGTYRGAVQPGAPGAIAADSDTAAEFGGSDQGVDVGNAPALNAGIADFAVEAWVKTLLNGEQVVITKDGFAGESWWLLSVTDDFGHIGQPRLKIFDGSSDNYAYGPTRVDDGSWHHVVAEVDRDRGITVYVDGSAATRSLSTPQALESTGDLLIAQARDAHYPDFRGTLDEVAIYPKVLGPAGVAEHFRLGIDSTALSVELTSPAAGARTNDPTPTFAGTAAVGSGASRTVLVNVYAGSSAAGTPVAASTAPVLDDGSYEATVGTALADGVYTAQAEQRDDAGNTGRSGAVTFVVDTTPPAVTLESPTNGATTGRAPLFAGRAGTATGDSATVAVEVYAGADASGPRRMTLSTERAADGAFSAAVAAPLDPGTYTAQAEQRDAAGNAGSSAPTTFVVSGVSGYAAEVASDGPTGYWRLGEASGPTARDQVGPNAGTYVGDVTFGHPGAVASDPDTAIGVDGTGAGVTIPDAAGLLVGASDFTVEAWVKTSVTDEQAIAGMEPDRGWLLTVTDDSNFQGRPRLKIFDGIAARYAYGAGRVDDGRWHHVVAEVDRDSGVTVYVDAVAATTPLPTPQPLDGGADLTIGRDSTYPGFQGELDEVVLYPTLLGASRVSAHHALAQSAPTPTETVWSADMETGDLSQWTQGGTHGGSYDSGACIRPPNGVTSEVAHSGKFSMKMTVDLGLGEAGCRQFRHEESRTGGTFYYGAWYYLPAPVTAVNYWNVFQFKSETATLNDPFWVLDLMPRADGSPHLRLRWKGTVVGPFADDTTTGTKNYDQTKADVPIGRWFHVEAYLRQASDSTGRLTIWQDGVELFDMVDVKTKYVGGDERWSVNNYSNGLLPSLATLYVDDATVATERTSR